MKTLREYLAWAKEKQVAIGHFNISDSEGFKAVVETAKELGVPVIIGVSEGERDFIGLEEVISLVKTARANGLPVFINADHTYSVEKAKLAIDAGVDSVIIDAADKTLEENVKMTREVVEYARSKNTEIIVEGELGFIGKSSKLLDALPEGVSLETQTKPEEALEFVRATGVAMLAPSVGNVHGIVKTGEPKLNIERIQAIAETVGIPLVLHGGSGNQEEEFREAIKAGIRIIHINTELRVAYKEGIEEGLKSGEIAPYKFLAEGVEEMKKVVLGRLKIFNML
ncbi:MAG: class II fructose-bisphosphate aldolase [bacterium]|nr:class II fructose-bisphosphate aldolase [bacterium]